jgi:hypothetical protein
MLTEQIVSIYVKLLPHEKPKLNSIDLKGHPQKGDPQNPLHMEVELTGPHCGLSPRGEPPDTRKRTCLLHEWRVHCGARVL